jgi:tryptophan-rich sensory protein
MFMIWFVLWVICAYAAYRAIKGGFESPQSERLNGIFGLVVVAAVILAWVCERLP